MAYRNCVWCGGFGDEWGEDANGNLVVKDCPVCNRTGSMSKKRYELWLFLYKLTKCWNNIRDWLFLVLIKFVK